MQFRRLRALLQRFVDGALRKPYGLTPAETGAGFPQVSELHRPPLGVS